MRVSYVIQIRFELTPTSRSAIAAATAEVTKRQGVWQRLANKVGVELIGQQWSLTHGVGVISVRGTIEQGMTIVQMLARNGAYQSVTQEILVDMEALQNNLPNLQAAECFFEAGDLDEIDRMLLDE
jgi:uncharacterized protein (UPF0210 family)